MHILLIARAVPTEENSQLGIFEFDQAKALASLGVHVTYFGVDLRSIRRRRKLGISHGVKDGVSWYTVSVPVGAVPSRILCNIGKKALIHLYRYVFKGKEKPNLLHAHFTEMGCIASELSKKEKLPLIITEHSSLMNQPVISKSLQKCAVEGYSTAKAVIAVSEALAKRIEQHTTVKCQVIPNIIDTDLFLRVRRIEHDGFWFVTTSNLIASKRTKMIIEAMNSFAKDNDSIGLYVIGDGELRLELEKYADACGLKNRIIFTGRLQREQIAEIYRKADAFVMPSATETFGVAYVEAMAAGLPVIATRCGGPEGFVYLENGILIDVDHLEQLKDAMGKMVTNACSYDSDAIKQAIAEKYAPQAVGKQILKVYQKIV